MLLKNLYVCLVALALASSAHARTVAVPKINIIASEKLGQVDVYRDKDGFFVMKDDEVYDVQNCYVENVLLKMSDNQLEQYLGYYQPPIVFITEEDLSNIDPSFVQPLQQETASQILERGTIVVKQLSDGQYTIKMGGGLLGGGFWGGICSFVAAKCVVHIIGQAICWGTAGAVAIICPPMFAPTLAGMEKVMLPVSEVVANKVGFGAAVVGMVATGPV